MSNNDQADFFVIFEGPDGKNALAVAFWDFGADASEPVKLLAKHMAGVVQSLLRKGYEAFGNVNPGFESYIVVKKGVDTVKARACGKMFLVEMASSLLDEIQGGKVQ